jgi:hypothetical protein
VWRVVVMFGVKALFDGTPELEMLFALSHS